MALASVPKVTVPTDFGIELLHDNFHGNISVALSNKDEMTVSSEILSFNSPLFIRLFKQIEDTFLDMADFDPAAVWKFMEALYSGEIELNEEIFRNVYKMSLVFEVTWLSEICKLVIIETYFMILIVAIIPLM